MPGIGFWILRPRMAMARLRYFIWERMNPDKVWLCPGTIAFCQSHLSKSMNALEFGSGISTQWFSGLVGHLISIEHNAIWYYQVKQQLANARISNVDYRLVLLNHPDRAPEQFDYPSVPDYVAIADTLPDKYLDFAVVDGHYRTHCVRHLIPKMASGGYLLVDDTDRWPSPESLPVPADWIKMIESTNGLKRCVIWKAP